MLSHSAVRVGAVRGRYFRENFAQGGIDLVQIVPELVTNADAAIAAGGRGHGRIELRFGAPDADVPSGTRVTVPLAAERLPPDGRLRALVSQLVQLRPVLEDPTRELWLELPPGAVEVVGVSTPRPDPEHPLHFDKEVAVTGDVRAHVTIRRSAQPLSAGCRARRATSGPRGGQPRHTRPGRSDAPPPGDGRGSRRPPTRRRCWRPPRPLRSRAHEKLMRAFLDEDLYEGRVRIDPPPRRATGQASLLGD